MGSPFLELLQTSHTFLQYAPSNIWKKEYHAEGDKINDSSLSSVAIRSFCLIILAQPLEAHSLTHLL